LSTRFTRLPDLRVVSAIVLLTAIALAPLWWVEVASTPGPVVTLGRVAIVLLGLLIAVQLSPRRWVTHPWQTTALAASAIGLGIWIVINARIWGCRCMSDVDGYIELMIVLIFCLIGSSNYPALRQPLIVAAGVSSFLASALALSGLHGLYSGARDVSATGGRLSGTYGNANYLGFAAAAAVPVLVAYLPHWTRGHLTWPRRVGLALAWLGALAVSIAALVETYSRSAIIAAFVGVVVVASLGCRSRRGRAGVLVVGTLCGITAAILLYPRLERERERASLRKPVPGPNLYADVGGWDGRVQGLIPQGLTRFHNDSLDRSLIVTPSRTGGGVSFAWGKAFAQKRYELTFEARAMSELVQLAAGMEDNSAGNSPSIRVFRHPLSRSWRALRVSWVPSAISPSARFYIWEPHARSAFALRGVHVRLDVSVDGAMKKVPIELRGSMYQVQLHEYRTAERSARASRLAAASLAINAFIASPVHGIGWQRFPDYAARHATYGQLATHNDYLRIAAELGVPGLVLFCIFAGTIVVAAAQLAWEDAVNRAAIGLLATGAVGLAFLNGIVSPNASIPFAVAVAVVCSSRVGSNAVEGPIARFKARSRRSSAVIEDNDRCEEVARTMEASISNSEQTRL
jgi:hypothetical protein